MESSVTAIGAELARCIAETWAACCMRSQNLGCARACRNGHPAVRLFEDWRELVADPAIDAVAIATPVSTHFDIARACLLAGKHVLVEKPMTMAAVEAELLIEEAAKRRLVLMVDHTFVYTGAVQKIQSLVASGEIGDLLYYNSTRVNLGLVQRDVNVIWDLAVHDLSILDALSVPRRLRSRPAAPATSAVGRRIWPISRCSTPTV